MSLISSQICLAQDYKCQGAQTKIHNVQLISLKVFHELAIAKTYLSLSLSVSL